MKICNKCLIEKPFSNFHTARQGKSAPILKSFCKECMRKYQREKYQSLDTAERKKKKGKKSLQYL